MKVLSVRQPWAHALLHLGKDPENRSWSTEHRGPVAIHASTRLDPAGARWARTAGFDVDTFPRGVIVGVVDLWDVVRGHRSPWAQLDAFHWRMRDPVALLDPIPWRGTLKLVELPAAITARIMADLAAQNRRPSTR
ncbi:MAG TPA: ASCH domain-containing protein [Pseudonocardiaceae bacterium]|nr:ASCH domain-containing protein [Pseudonocardiaceae bacterium]